MEMLDEYHIDVDGQTLRGGGSEQHRGQTHGHAAAPRGTAPSPSATASTPDLAAVTRQADILVSAVGRRNVITADMVKEGAVVIDVAMNRNEQGKLCGDVDFAAVAEDRLLHHPRPRRRAAP